MFGGYEVKKAKISGVELAFALVLAMIAAMAVVL